MTIKILSPGPLSTVQDLGRVGYMNSGFSQNGAMDTYAAQLANILVGNPRTCGVIEMTFMGLSAEFDTDAVISVTGADMQPKINGESIKMYTACQVRKGDTLTFGVAKNGMRSYLAIAGGFDIPKKMDSESTNIKCKVGGYLGRRLAGGDEIFLKRGTRLKDKSTRTFKPTEYPESFTVRVILGPQDDYFTKEGKEKFLSSAYTVSDKSDRMGIRFDGEAVESISGVDIISDGIVFGSVQIPASGKPIIMMADRQTTGGYAKIATVISADLPLLAQARPGSQVKFVAVSERCALNLLEKREKELKRLERKF